MDVLSILRPYLKPLMVILLTLTLTLDGAGEVLVQGEEPVVTVVSVDSQSFPEITATLRVRNEGAPGLASLTAADFEILEGLDLDQARITNVEAMATDSFSLALVIDLSTPRETLPPVQDAYQEFIDTLGPGYKISLYSLYDQVTPLQTFTTDRELLKEKINTLSVEGDYTAFNEVIANAVSALDKQKAQAKAVIVTTNFGDNISKISAVAAIKKAQAANTPIHTIGYGNIVRTAQLQEMSQETGGQSIIVQSPDDILAGLQKVILPIQQDYQVTFISSLAADNAEHNFTVWLPSRDQEVSTEGTLRAVPSEVKFELSGLEPQQVVTDTQTITVKPLTPAPIESLEYWLDGELLRRVEPPPYDYTLDSTNLSPGSHTLEIRVTDEAGNEARLEHKFTSPDPVNITPRAAMGSGDKADEIVLEAGVEPETAIRTVTFWVDDQPLGTLTEPPYRLAVARDTFSDGEQVIRVVARDELGRTVENDVQFVLVPVEAPSSALMPLAVWSYWLARIGLLLLGLLLIAALGILITIWQRRKIEVHYQVGIRNMGNTQSRYELWAQTAFSDLQFRFTGKNLESLSIIESVVKPGLSLPTPRVDTSKTYTQTRIRTTSFVPPNDQIAIDLAVFPTKLHLLQEQVCTFSIVSKTVEREDAPEEYKGEVEFKRLSWTERYVWPILLFTFLTVLIALFIYYLLFITGL